MLCEKLFFRNRRSVAADKGVSWLAGAVAFVSSRFFFGPDGVRLAGAGTLVSPCFEQAPHVTLQPVVKEHRPFARLALQICGERTSEQREPANEG